MLYPLKQLLSDGLNLLSANLFALENEDGLDGKEGDGAACAVLREDKDCDPRSCPPPDVARRAGHKDCVCVSLFYVNDMTGHCLWT